MAKYTIISDVGQAITNILREKLVPEPIDKSEKIGICEPKDRGDYIVGIHPYDIKEDLTAQKREPIHLPDGREQDPPSMIELYYMISVSSKAQIEVKSAEESRIIGKIIQVFKDNQVIPQKYLPDDSKIEEIPISMIPLEMEEKVKIWTMFGESYKLSVFYLVGPVAIDSEVVRKPEKRVETFIIGTSQRIPRKIVQFETRITEEDIDDEYTQDYAEENSEEEEEGLEEDEELLDDSEKDIEDEEGEDTSELDDLFDDKEEDDESDEDDELDDENEESDENEDLDEEIEDDESKSDENSDEENDESESEDEILESDDEENDDTESESEDEILESDDEENDDTDLESNSDKNKKNENKTSNDESDEEIEEDDDNNNESNSDENDNEGDENDENDEDDEEKSKDK